MTLRPPTWALDLNITHRQTVSQAVKTLSNNGRNAATPKPQQNRWRMPEERMELMCQYLARVGQEKKAQHDQARHRLHCTQQAALLPSQMESLVALVVKVIEARGLLYDDNISLSRYDWAVVRHAFDREFEEDTNLSVLKCAMKKERYKYVIALFRQRCKTAKEKQPEMGEEYWHWMEI